MKELQIILGCLTIIGFVCSTFVYVRARIEQNYGAKRDFLHLKNSVDQLSENVGTLYGELAEDHEQLKDDLKEVKAYCASFSQRMDSMLTRLEMNSSIFARRHD